MAEYLKLASSLQKGFDRVKITQISRGQNSHTDSLATLASPLEDGIPQIILMEVVNQPSIERRCCMAVALAIVPSWMDPIMLIIIDGSLMSEPKEADKI